MSGDVPSRPGEAINAHVGVVNAVRFNRSGLYCVTCGADKFIRLWNPYKRLLIKSYIGHGYEIADVALSTDNNHMASCGGDKLVFLWDVATAKNVRRFGGTRDGGHTARINSVSFGGMDDAVLVSGSYDTSVRIWDVRSRSADPVQVLDEARDSISNVITSEHLIVSSSVDGVVRVYDIRTGRITEDVIGAPTVHATLSNDGNCILTASLDGKVRLLDRESGEVLAVYSGHEHRQFKSECGLLYDDSTVICGSEDGRLAFWDLVDNAGAFLACVKAHKSAVSSVAAHPSKPICISASHDGKLVLWSA